MPACDGPKATAYQTGTINSLANAVYDGDRDIAWVKSKGNFGLGTFAMVDGELIVCDGTFYRADENAALTVPADSEVLPFGVVCDFKPDVSFDLLNTDYPATADYLARYLVSKNLIYAIRIDGLFDTMRVRSERSQPKTYRKMHETLPSLQRVHQRDDIEGTMVGFWYPKYLSRINVAGFHFHFLDGARSIGGHVFEFQLAQGHVSIQTIKSLQIDLIDNNQFAQADLDADTPVP
ncbi:MAG: acetolactate decarboxylase [Mycolicibacterium sp.]|uniref:acetolactate decarboxylase n=1 Tax=Mycolicibacterium sp. TaxID=2320850 RepID=UPI003D148223